MSPLEPKGQRLDTGEASEIFQRERAPDRLGIGGPRGALPVDVVPPRHLEAPVRSFPFHVGRTSGLVSNTDRLIVSFTIEDGRVGYINFIEEELSGFSAGVLEEMVEFRLVILGGAGIPPYRRHTHALSPRGTPHRGFFPDPIQQGQTIELHARVLNTVDGGLDGGQVDVFGSIGGWMIESIRQE